MGRSVVHTLQSITHYTLHITHYMSPGPVMDAVTSPLSPSPLRPPHYIFLLELATKVREVSTITTEAYKGIFLVKSAQESIKTHGKSRCETELPTQ